MAENTLPEFQRFKAVLDKVGAVSDPAETHATLCGLICAGGRVDTLSWWQSILAEDQVLEQATEAHPVFRQVYTVTVAQLGDSEANFELLLPNESESLALRVAALSAWCQGFLYGLGLAGLDDFDESPDVVHEIARDFAQISRLSEGDDSEDDEKAYAELVEYVRMGVLLVYDELHGREGDPSNHRVLH